MKPGQKVKIYYNLHKQCLSVVSREGSDRGRVICYVDTIHLEDVTFKVSTKGRERVLREGVKNVHAFVYGTVAQFTTTFVYNQITYNPHKYTTFVDKYSLEPIYEARNAIIHGKQIICN